MIFLLVLVNYFPNVEIWSWWQEPINFTDLPVVKNNYISKIIGVVLGCKAMIYLFILGKYVYSSSTKDDMKDPGVEDEQDDPDLERG